MDKQIRTDAFAVLWMIRMRETTWCRSTAADQVQTKYSNLEDQAKSHPANPTPTLTSNKLDLPSHVLVQHLKKTYQ